MLCKKCNLIKGNSEFYSYAGSTCKKCNVLRSARWRKENLEKSKQIRKKYNHSLKGQIAAKRWRKRYKKQIREYYQSWYAKNGRNRSVDYQEAIIEWQKKHPDAVKARRKVYSALKNGKIIKSILCNQCNKRKKLSGHHQDYNKPLDVIWLCSSCHKLRHLTIPP